MGNKQKQYEYNDKYQKENIKRIVVKLNRKIESDKQMIDYLASKDNVQGYIKDLIRADMNM